MKSKLWFRQKTEGSKYFSLKWWSKYHPGMMVKVDQNDGKNCAQNDSQKNQTWRWKVVLIVVVKNVTENHGNNGPQKIMAKLLVRIVIKKLLEKGHQNKGWGGWKKKWSIILIKNVVQIVVKLGDQKVLRTVVKSSEKRW